MKSVRVSILIILLSLAIVFGFAAPGVSLAAAIDLSTAPSKVATENQFYLPLVNRLVRRQYTLTIWHSWSGQVFNEYQQILAEYQLAHPNVSIVTAKPDDMSAALQAAIPAGQGPDMVGWANDHIGWLATEQMIAPLDNYFSPATLSSIFEPAAVKGNIWKNQVWGVPDTQEGIALVYNKDLISAADLPNPDDFAGLLSKAQQFEQSHSGKFYLCNQSLGGVDAYHVAPIYFGFGLMGRYKLETQ